MTETREKCITSWALRRFDVLTLNIQSHRDRSGPLLSPDGTVVPPSILSPGLEDWIWDRLSISEPGNVRGCRTARHTGETDIISLCHRARLYNGGQLWFRNRSRNRYFTTIHLIHDKFTFIDYFVFTFYWQSNKCFTRPSVPVCRKSEEVRSYISGLYIIDLQTTVMLGVAHIFKVVWV